MAKKRSQSIDSVGWSFWLGTFFLFMGPSIWLCWLAKVKDVAWIVPVGLGLFLSSVVAGFFSYGVNSVLHQRRIRKRHAHRKQVKKKK